MFQDEARFGRISDVRRCWAPKPLRPVCQGMLTREYTYAYGAVDVCTGELESLILPHVNTQCMQLFFLMKSRHARRLWQDRHSDQTTHGVLPFQALRCTTVARRHSPRRRALPRAPGYLANDAKLGVVIGVGSNAHCPHNRGISGYSFAKRAFTDLDAEQPSQPWVKLRSHQSPSCLAEPARESTSASVTKGGCCVKPGAPSPRFSSTTRQQGRGRLRACLFS